MQQNNTTISKSESVIGQRINGKQNKEQECNILSYNTNGLKNKINHYDFFNYVTEFDIFMLIETHVMQGEESIFDKFFVDFCVHWDFATRSNGFGRGIGGMALGFKKHFLKGSSTAVVKTVNEMIVIELKLSGKICSLVPLYIRGAVWNSDFAKLKQLMDSNLLNPILCGDVNVRIGESQQTIDEHLLQGIELNTKRSSKDKVVSGDGKKYMEMLDENGLILLNGRTKGDSEGEFSFISTVGRSVNDLCALSYGALDLYASFEIQICPWSDHMPLVFNLKNVKQALQENEKLPPKLYYKSKEVYQNKLTSHTNTVMSTNEDINLESLVTMIKLSTDQKKACARFIQPWYNFRCLNAKKRMMKCLKHLKNCQDDDDGDLKFMYRYAKHHYLRICEDSKNSYEQRLFEKINSIKSTADWWKVTNQLKNRPQVTRGSVPVESFRQYFSELLNPPLTSSPFQYAEQNNTDAVLDGEITMNELLVVLKNVKPNKAPGEDRVSYECLKDSPENFKECMLMFFNKILSGHTISDAFKSTLFLPLHKKGDVNVAANYRGIGNMNAIPKTFMGIMFNRLNEWVTRNRILNEFQAGFRKQYSTTDDLYNLFCIVNLKSLEGKCVYGFFVDFKAAFDSIDRQALFYKLTNMGISSKFLALLRRLYSNTNAKVWSNGDLSEEFNMKMGVKQGCLLSPLLFTLMLNDLPDCVGGGVNVGHLKVGMLMYADDIIMLAESRDTLQLMINRLQRYCQLWNLTVNLLKSQIMVFNRSGRTPNSEVWYFNREPIKVVKQYKYLGLLVTPNLNLNLHFTERRNVCKASTQSVWNEFFLKDEISFQQKMCLFNAATRAMYTSGAAIWGFKYFDDTDKFQRSFIKNVLNVPSFTPNYILHIETKVDPLHLFTLEMHMKYVWKTLFIYTDDRLPHQLSKMVFNKKVYWTNQWCQMWPLEEDTNWPNCRFSKNGWLQRINFQLNRLRHDMWVEAFGKAGNSSHGVYKNLNTNVNYMGTVSSMRSATWILKARSGLLKLNSNIQVSSQSTLCSLCGAENETVDHFLGRCARLMDCRIRHLNSCDLSIGEVTQLLNGLYIDWRTVADFVKDCVNIKQAVLGGTI